MRAKAAINWRAWFRRGKRYETSTATMTRWWAQEAPICVVGVRSHFGLPVRYLVVERVGVETSYERIVSTHRKRCCALAAALRLLEQTREVEA